MCRAVFAAGVVALACTVGGCAPRRPSRAAADARGPNPLYFDPGRLSGANLDSTTDALASLETTQVNVAHLVALALHISATVWLVSHDACPTVGELLVGYHVVSPNDDRDAWDTPFMITCSDGGAEVRSAGPDGHFGTSDDVVAAGR